MKKAALIFGIALTTAATFAQGRVNFANASTALLGDNTKLNHWTDLAQPGVVVGASERQGLVSSIGLTAGALVVSNQFPGLRAQLYWGSSSATSLSQLTSVTGPAAPFRPSTSINVGSWIGGNRTVNQWASGEHHELAVIVWDINQAPDGFAALAGISGSTYNGLYGQSALFDYLVPDPLDPPTFANIVNLQRFDVGYYEHIPEPSSLALFGLGAAAWLTFRWRR